MSLVHDQPIAIRLHGNRASILRNPACYRIAEQLIVSDVAWPNLEPFRVPAPVPLNLEQVVSRGDDPADVMNGEARQVTGYVGGARRRVSIRWVAHRCRVAIPEIGMFIVDTGDGAIRAAKLHRDPASAEVLMTVLGPLLVLALAARGVWCLHASAVAVDAGVCLFLGPSGAGKSTLAAELARRGLSGPRLADDIVAVRYAEPGIEILPEFPQPKLGTAEQYTGSRVFRPARLFILRSLCPKAPETHFAAHRMPTGTATYAVADGTVALTLMSRDLRAAHLELGTRIASHAPVYEIDYPRNGPSIVAMADLLAPPSTVHHDAYPLRS